MPPLLASRAGDGSYPLWSSELCFLFGFVSLLLELFYCYNVSNVLIEIMSKDFSLGKSANSKLGVISEACSSLQWDSTVGITPKAPEPPAMDPPFFPFSFVSVNLGSVPVPKAAGTTWNGNGVWNNLSHQPWNQTFM